MSCNLFMPNNWAYVQPSINGGTTTQMWQLMNNSTMRLRVTQVGYDGRLGQPIYVNSGTGIAPTASYTQAAFQIAAKGGGEFIPVHGGKDKMLIMVRGNGAGGNAILEIPMKAVVGHIIVVDVYIARSVTALHIGLGAHLARDQGLAAIGADHDAGRDLPHRTAGLIQMHARDMAGRANRQIHDRDPMAHIGTRLPRGIHQHGIMGGAARCAEKIDAMVRSDIHVDHVIVAIVKHSMANRRRMGGHQPVQQALAQ